MEVESASLNVLLRKTTTKTSEDAKVSLPALSLRSKGSFISWLAAPRFGTATNGCLECCREEKPGFGWHLAGTNL
jgi:hypothetical protein